MWVMAPVDGFAEKAVIPADVAQSLPPEGLEVEGLGFIIFPNG